MSFESPYLLVVLLLVPLMLTAALWIDRRRARYTVAFTNLDLLASVASTRRSYRRWAPLVLFLFALATAGVAVARPSANVAAPSQRATIVLLVDVSGSMRASDVKPTRLGAAQAAMETFLHEVPRTVKVGLVSFSTEPNVLVLPTTDKEQVREGIELLVPEAGTAIGDGIAMAVRVVQSSIGNSHHAKGQAPGAILLLSDGAQTRGVLKPLDGAARAHAAGIPIYTIALGTNHGTLNIPGFSFGFGGGGGRFLVRPDPAILQAIAQATGGIAYRAQSASKVQAVYKRLGSSVARKATRREISSWFAGAAAFLLLGSLAAARVTGERLP